MFDNASQSEGGKNGFCRCPHESSPFIEGRKVGDDLSLREGWLLDHPKNRSARGAESVEGVTQDPKGPEDEGDVWGDSVSPARSDH